jgi:hypothetical protein
MTLYDPIGSIIEARLVERMRHLADKPPYSVAREHSVGVERDDVADVLRNARWVTVSSYKSGVGSSTQQSIQLVQLTALAFPPDPSALALIPYTSAMQQQETVASRRGPVSMIETRNAVRGCPAQFLIAFGGLARSIGPVR